MDKIYFIKALKKLRPGASWTIENEELIWNDKVQTKPRDIEITNMINIIKTEELANDYKIKRQIEYNKLNQLEMIYDDMMNDTHNWEAAIKKIKAKYPKPNK